MSNMIGYPDNIRRSDHGTFLVGITTTRFRRLLPPFLDMIAPYPAVKRFLAKVSVSVTITFVISFTMVFIAAGVVTVGEKLLQALLMSSLKNFRGSLFLKRVQLNLTMLQPFSRSQPVCLCVSDLTLWASG